MSTFTFGDILDGINKNEEPEPTIKTDTLDDINEEDS